MNQKDLKKLAKKIASLEKQLQNADLTEIEQDEIEMEIEGLCCKVTSWQDIDQLDELIQENLKKD